MQFARLIATAIFALGLTAAHAHETPAKHGGIVQEAGDLAFEFVALPDGAALYLYDHGKPMPLAGTTGKLTVLVGKEKSEMPLTVASDRLEAKGAPLPKGARAVATVTTAKKKTLTVRFTVK